MHALQLAVSVLRMLEVRHGEEVAQEPQTEASPYNIVEGIGVATTPSGCTRQGLPARCYLQWEVRTQDYLIPKRVGEMLVT